MKRRDFLRGAAMTAMGVLAVSCAQPTPQVIEKEVPVEKIVKETVIVEKEVPVEKIVKETVVVERQISIEKVVTATPVPLKYKESPALTELVKAGKLPPVDERLPEDPLVVPVIEKIGKYGGDWRLPTTGAADGAMYTRGVEYDCVARWDVEWTTIIPDIATGWEVNDDATEFTFYLRKGMKWSDGEPFTSEDIYWWYVEQTTKELTPRMDTRFTIKGQEPQVTKIDDFTIRFTYPQSFGFFLLNLPQPHGLQVIVPAHFRKQFMPGYGDEKFIARKVKEAGVSNWYEAYGGWTGALVNPEAPTIHAWKYTSPLGRDPVFIAVRNPYYYKVDPEGQQLPYIDRQIYTVGDREAHTLAAIAGEIDYDYRHTPTLANKPLFVENLEKADLRFVTTVSTGCGDGLKLNLCHKDPILREIFNNKKFRIALSHAINRQEIIDVVALGQGTPHQVAPTKGMPFYSEKMATQYLEYDPALANKLLDEILPNKNEEGIRLRPDGKPLQFTCDISSGSQARIDMMEMVKKYWMDVGVKVELNVIARALFYERFGANEHDMNIWGGHNELLDPGSMVAVQSNSASKWANEWAVWYETGGKSGQEPPEPMKKNQATWDEIQSARSIDEMNELMKQIVAVAEEQFWVIGTYRGAPGYSIVKKKFRNVPEVGISSWRYPDPGPYNTCQFFWDV